jgi:hypothetical protein
VTAIRILGFAPDLDPAEPGILVDTDNVYPTLRGIGALPSPKDIGFPALTKRVVGGISLANVTGSVRTFAGTADRLYEAGASAWTDVSVTGGYTGSDDSRWRFAQFGNVTLATNKVDPMQSSTSGVFANLGGTPPKSALIETVGLAEGVFAFAADTNDGTDDLQDRWWSSAIGNHADWVPNIATQAANGRLVDTPEGIIGLKKFGIKIILYKERAMYIGEYMGPPIIWGMSLISNNIGAVSHEAVVDIGNAHIFAGYDDFYYFDGSRPVSIGSQVREFFRSDYSYTYRRKIMALHDWNRGIIHWFYPSSRSSTGLADKVITYNYRADKWARSDVATLLGVVGLTAEYPVSYNTQGPTWDQMGSFYATWDDLPQISYDSPFWLGDSSKPAFFSSGHKFFIMRGDPESSSIVTGDYGDHFRFSAIRDMRASYFSEPTVAKLTNFYRSVRGAPLVKGVTTTQQNGRFNVRRSSRWHRFRLDFTGPMEILGFDFDMVGRGKH